jgi:deoxycytidylate deaminase
MNNKVKYFNIAREVSRLSDFQKVHIGAVIIYRKQILAVGYNQNKSHTLQKLYNRYRDFNNQDCVNHCIHAECDAIAKCRHLDIDWSKAEIYTYRDHKITGELMLAKPCPACMNLIRSMTYYFMTPIFTYCINYILMITIYSYFSKIYIINFYYNHSLTY